MTLSETFLPIKDYPKYAVSNKGRVKSFWKRRSKVIILSPFITNAGYPTVLLTNDVGRKHKTIHSLVLKTFKGEHPGLDCNHIDGDKMNNSLENLEWCTRSENVQHAYDIGLAHAVEHDCVAVEQLTKDGQFIAYFRSKNEALRQTKVYNITKVCRGERKTAGGFKWRYVDVT